MSETPSARGTSDRVAGILVAAGSSARMRAGGAATGPRKPLLEIGGRTLVELACAAFDACPSVEEIVVAAHPEDLGLVERLCAERPLLAKVRRVVPGGAERADSVRLACRAASDYGTGLLAVHDAARPLASRELLERVVAAAASHGAAIPALPIADTVKRSADGGRTAERTLDRSELHAAQTPQVFEAARFLELLERAEVEGFRPTDDAGLWERYVGPVALVEGDPANRKVTRPEDLELVRALLERASAGTGSPGTRGRIESPIR